MFKAEKKFCAVSYIIAKKLILVLATLRIEYTTVGSDLKHMLFASYDPNLKMTTQGTLAC